MSPGSSARVVTGLWAPSVLSPDWNQTQVSRSSLSGKARAISASIASRPAIATSISRVPAPDRVADRGAADVGDPGALADQRDLGRRLQHPLAHRGGGDVGDRGGREEGVELFARLQRQVVALDPDPAAVPVSERTARQ